MNLLLDQRNDGLFNVIDEDGKVLSTEPLTRPQAYAFIERLEQEPGA